MKKIPRYRESCCCKISLVKNQLTSSGRCIQMLAGSMWQFARAMISGPTKTSYKSKSIFSIRTKTMRCFHPVRVFYEDGAAQDSIFPEETSGFTAQKLVEGVIIYRQTLLCIVKTTEV